LNFGESFKRSGIAGVGFLSVGVRKTGREAQSLSHGCAAPAPFTSNAVNLREKNESKEEKTCKM